MLQGEFNLACNEEDWNDRIFTAYYPDLPGEASMILVLNRWYFGSGRVLVGMGWTRHCRQSYAVL